MKSHKSRLRKRTAVLLLALMMGSGLENAAMAFKIPFHKQITREILGSQGYEQESASVVAEANGSTDTSEPTNAAAHADNNQLGAASGRLRQKRTEIGDSLNSCNRLQALESFGQALHTVQDIYSHSNSVDNGIPIPDLLSLSDGTAACSLPGFAPGGLVTGYFSTAGWFLGNQCRNMPAGMCCHRDLNKDAPDEANGARHSIALNAARGGTQTYIELVEQDIRARFGEPKATQLLKMLKRRQRTTFFVIDDTGSMGGDIAGVKASVNQFLDQLIAGDEAPTLGLVTFKDDVNDRGPTCDIAALRSQVNALFASGGGDCPEASNSGLLSALGHFPILSSNQQLRGGRILLATDASAGDAYLGPLVWAQATLRGVSIDAILTGDCTAEEFAPAALSAGFEPSDNEPGGTAGPIAVARAAAASDPLTSGSARTQLRALTEQTGGVLFNVARVEVDDVVPTLLELGEPDNALLFSRKIELLSGAPYIVEIPVDDTLRDKVTFMVTASRAGILPAFTLRRPDGSVVAAGDPNVVLRSLSSVKTWAVTAPAVGRWKIQLDGQGSFMLRAFGGTPFRIDSLTLLSETLERPRPEVDAVPIEGQPVAGANLLAEIGLTDAPREVPDVALRQLDGDLLDEPVFHAADSDRLFRSGVHIPGEPFLVEVTGLTPAGAEFVRQAAVPVVPQTVSLEISPKVTEAAPGSAVALTATVHNAASAPGTFRLLASSSLGWSVLPPSDFTVGAGGTASVDLTVLVPAAAAVGERNDITVFVEDVSAPQTRNSTLASVIVGGNTPPDCSGAQASPARVWPPDHKMVGVQVLGITDADTDPVTLSVTAISQDEPVNESGSGNTAPDADGLGTATPRIRAERAGGGDGRVYAIHFTASDGRGGTCSGTVTVGVPHDAKGTAVDSGQTYDSTASNP